MSIADQLMKGAIDFHVHANPDPFYERRLDAIEIAHQASAAGMSAVVIKCHHYCTAPLAYIVNQLTPGFSLLGSLVLNREAGGLNPDVVEVAARTGARVIWMPTLSSVVDTGRRKENKRYPLKAVSDDGISITGQDGKLVPQIAPILEIIKSNNIVLATGHISVPEIYALVTEAKRMQVKVIVTHPLTEIAGSLLSIKQQQELVSEGAYIEHCFFACMPLIQGLNPAVMVEHIKAVGAERCVLSTDFGQEYNPAPAEGFRMMLATMLRAGLSEKELETITKVNPARLLDLD